MSKIIIRDKGKRVLIKMNSSFLALLDVEVPKIEH